MTFPITFLASGSIMVHCLCPCGCGEPVETTLDDGGNIIGPMVCEACGNREHLDRRIGP